MNVGSLHAKGTNGKTFHVRKWGQCGPACVLLHGLGDCSYVWDEFACAIAVSFRVFGVDLRGHGDSSWDPFERYDTAAHLSDVSDVLTSIGIDQFIVIGHSLGGEIALRLAASCGTQVIGLVVVDAGPELTPEGIERFQINFRSEFRVYQSIAEYAAQIGETLQLADPGILLRLAPHKLRPHEIGYVLKCDPALLDQRMARRSERTELWNMIRLVQCPTLVIRGEASAVLSQSVAKRMAAEFPAGQLEVIKMAGHSVMIENPAQFGSAVRRFLQRYLLQNAPQ